MWTDFPLFPEQASTVAGRVDALYLYLVLVTVFFTALIFFFVIFFAVKYRRRSEKEIPPAIHGSLALEFIWSFIPFVLVMIMFVWGTKLYFAMAQPPEGTLDVQVIGKQWMWKIQHIDGRREINELHVPLGSPVKLIMTSEDVIHCFFIPAFRVKADVLPGRYSTIWFEATKTGEFHLFCAEYCGTKHSEMVGRVVVMEPAEYSTWLSGGQTAETPVAAGERLFKLLGCMPCHSTESGSRGPDLQGLYRKPVKLADGRTVTADETYLRESIVDPQAKVVAAFGTTLMPGFKTLIDEEGIFQIIAYIKSLNRDEAREAEE